MSNTLKNLETTQILYAENVITLKNTIAQKYPNASSKERADLLSKAIKHILRSNLSSFDEKMQQALIQDLLKTIVQKQSFSLNAQDVVNAYTTLNPPSIETNLSPLAAVSEATEHKLLAEYFTTSYQKAAIPPLSNAPYSNITSPLHTNLSSPPTLDDNSVEPTAIHISSIHTSKLKPYRLPQHIKLVSSIIGFLSITSCILIFTLHSKSVTPLEVSTEISKPIATPTPLTFAIPEEDYLMIHLQYKTINETALKDWLINRGSMLAEEPYFSTILEAAASYNINPLLMFAITGQEQGFVPKSHHRALEIVNNPFNVYGSWQDFNTSIEDTAFIAARTIINLSKGCPEDADPIKWLNKKYAEDPKWHLGVTALLKQLEEVAG